MGSMHMTIALVSIAIPTLIYAMTNHVEGKGMVLTVYRSPVITEADVEYAPVAQALKDSDYRLVSQESVTDIDMVFGQAELSVYLLKE